MSSPHHFSSSSIALGGRLRSFYHAGAGLWRLIREEKNARLHVVATALVIAAGAWLKLTYVEWGLVILAIVGVLAAEAANSAIERLADAVTPDHHPLIGAAKDLAAASVLLVAMGALLVGVLVFGQRCLH